MTEDIWHKSVLCDASLRPSQKIELELVRKVDVWKGRIFECKVHICANWKAAFINVYMHLYSAAVFMRHANMLRQLGVLFTRYHVQRKVNARALRVVN